MNPMRKMKSLAVKAPSATTQDIKRLLKHWLVIRQQLIIQFNGLCQLRPFESNRNAATLEDGVLRFCQTLLDYVAMGQFQIFEQVLSHMEQSDATPKIPTDLFTQLKRTALEALAFSDKYAETTLLPYMLEKDLNTIGQQLACRFDLEDALLRYFPMQITPAYQIKKP